MNIAHQHKEVIKILNCSQSYCTSLRKHHKLKITFSSAGYIMKNQWKYLSPDTVNIILRRYVNA